MDEKGRWMDRVFIERLRQSAKHEGGSPRAPTAVHSLERLLRRWFTGRKRRKPRQALS